MRSDDRIYLISTQSDRVQLSVIQFTPGGVSFATTINKEYGNGSVPFIASYAIFDPAYSFAYVTGSSNNRISLSKINLVTGAPTFTYFVNHAGGSSNKLMIDLWFFAGSTAYAIFSCAENLGADSNDIGFFYFSENFGGNPNLVYTGFLDYTIPTQCVDLRMTGVGTAYYLLH